MHNSPMTASRQVMLSSAFSKRPSQSEVRVLYSVKYSAPVWICASLLLLAASARGYQALPTTLRVLTYNIHHGEGTDGRFDVPRLAEVIKSVRPDLVALQEVDEGTERARDRKSVVEGKSGDLGGC